MKGKPRAWGIGAALTAGSLIAIGLVTLLPNRNPTAHQSCCVTPDFVLNVLLFVPLGIGLALLGLSGLGAAVVGAALSGGIELSQISLIPGRDSSLHDVVSNTLGTCGGALIVQFWGQRREWWRWAGGALTVMFLLFALAGPWLVTPAYPERRGWYSQWQHDFRGMAAFPGRILSFSIQDIELPDGDVANRDELRADLIASDTVQANLQFESASPFEGKAQLAGLVAGWPGPWLFNFVQERTDLLVSARFRMSDLGFRSPLFRVLDDLPANPGHTVDIAASLSRKSLHIAVRDSSVAESTFPLSTELAWAAFLPITELTPSSETWIRGGAAFLGLLSFGLGAGKNRWVRGIGVLCWLLSGPLLFGLSFPGPLIVGLGLAGLALGSAANRVLALG